MIVKAGRLTALLLGGALAGVFVGRWATREAAGLPADTMRERPKVVAVRGEGAKAREARTSARQEWGNEMQTQTGVEERVFAASGAGRHEEAVALAAEAQEERTRLLTAAYHAWAQREPEVALDAALMLDDPERRRVAFHAAVSGWAKVEPRSLAECARGFPEGPERSFALVAALRAWRRREAAEAERWLAAHPTTILPARERALIAED